MKRSAVSLAALMLLALSTVGLPAAPASAATACSGAQVGWVFLRGFPSEMNRQPPNFYYTPEGQDATFQVEGSIDCAPGETTATRYDTPPGTTNPADPGDYTRKEGLLTFGPSTSEHHFETKTVTLDFHGDSAVEPLAEEVNVRLLDPVNAGLGEPPQAPFYIVDDDGPSRLRFVTSSRTVSEFATTLRIPLLLAGTSATAPVSFSVSPASASDIEPTTGSVAWASAGRLGIVSLQVKGDTVCESAESYTVSLSAGSASVESPSTFTLTINDNDCGTSTLRSLSVSKTGTGTGTVTSSPAGINCGTDCYETYPNGTSVTLTATPSAGSTFAGWSGGCTGTSTTCTVTMDASKTVTATFNQTTTTMRTLTVAKSGAGGGTVTSSPAGISCGSDCSEGYADGTSVTLTASPAAGSTFAGWSGACTGTSTTCTVTMSADRSVTAAFDTTTTTTHTLTVSKSGTGTGTVSSNPAGISCGTDCSEAYASGSNVTLTATPTKGVAFGGWSGDCSGTQLTCTVSMTQARNVTATFGSPTGGGGGSSLTVTRSGSGTVTSSPAGISCGSDCFEAYASGTSVTLTATPVKGSVFAGWGGACSGTTTTCVVTVSGATSVTATFRAP